jgi:hypothetical protein
MREGGRCIQGVQGTHHSEERYMNTYTYRNCLLRKLGYDSYEQYLQSTKWAWIRNRAYLYHGRLCLLCSAPATQIHHLGYGWEVLVGLNVKPLAPVCRPCHDKVEFRPDGSKRTLIESQGEYMRLLEEARKSGKVPKPPKYPGKKRRKRR